MEINYLAVLLCGVASMVVGFVWYGPLFGKAYMKIMGSDTMTAEEKAGMKSQMWIYYAVQFVLSLVMAGVLAYHLVNWGGDGSALGISLCIWFGFVMTTVAGGALWSGKPLPVSFKLFLISAGGHLVTFIVWGLILGAWM